MDPQLQHSLIDNIVASLVKGIFYIGCLYDAGVAPYDAHWTGYTSLVYAAQQRAVGQSRCKFLG